MTMSRTLTRSLAVAALLALPLMAVSSSFGQDAPKDEALDNLLKKLEDKAKPEAPAAEPKADKDEKPTAEKPKPAPNEGEKPSGEVAGKDKDIDSLLEKLGATEDKASPDDRKRGGEGPTGRDDLPPPPPGKPGDDKDKPKKDDPNALSGKAKDLDEHLEELTGKKRKKNRGDDGEGSGPLSDVVKQMREVEQRLGKTDTGDETRKKQTQIVKRIDTLIEQMRSSTSQSQGKPRPGKPQPGNQPGQQLSNQPGTTGGNAPYTKPLKPTDRKSMAGGKEAWGHLPPELRQEMENVFREEPLPSREELIRRYYLSVSKKSLTRGE
jgi:hypothetical protein